MLLCALAVCSKDKVVVERELGPEAVQQWDRVVAACLPNPVLRLPALVCMARRHQLPPVESDMLALAACAQSLAETLISPGNMSLLEGTLALLHAKLVAMPNAKIIESLCPHSCDATKALSTLERAAAASLDKLSVLCVQLRKIAELRFAVARRVV